MLTNNDDGLHLNLWKARCTGNMQTGSGTRNRNFSAGILLAILAVIISETAIAGTWRYQKSDRSWTVANRARPAYDAPGIRTGGFILYPEFYIRATHNDNIFATQTSAIKDQILIVRPVLSLRSNWTRHQLNFTADAALGRYVDFDSEDYDDYFVGVDGRADISRDNRFGGGISYARLHEDRGSPDDARGIQPTVYYVASPRAWYFHKLNRYSVRLGTSLRQLKFDDVEALSPQGLMTIDNSDRDRDVLQGSLRFGYEIVPQYEAFIRGTVNSVSYDVTPDRTGFVSDTDGYQLTAGAAFDLPGVSFGELYAGYLAQDFDDPRFQDFDDITFGGALTWNVTQLTTINASLGRNPRATTVSGASSIRQTRLGVNIDHELRRNVLLNARVFYTTEDYNGIAREDDYTGFRIGSKYLVNRNLYNLTI